MNWKPIGDQVLVKQQEKQEKTASGIIVMTGMDDYVTCDVIATGDGLFTQTGDRIPMTTKPGMQIKVYNGNIGSQKKLTIEGEEYILLRESEIAMINIAQ
jgi:co-chaperonin GroES (HSP10)